MRVRVGNGPAFVLDLGARHGDPIGAPSRGGVLATAGRPPKIPAGMGHTHGQWEKHKERERSKRAQQRWKDGGG